MQVSNIYSETLTRLRFGTRRIIHQGGSYSGKTVNILGALATLCAEEDSGITTVTSMSFPHLKGGALRDFETYVFPSFKNSIKSYHKTDHIFTFRSGSLLEFKVFESEMNARGQKRKRLFVNEANKFDWMVFFQLDSRSEQTLIDYNPSIRFWAHEKLIGQDGNTTFISYHKHNPFLPESKHAEIESYCTFNEDGQAIAKAGLIPPKECVVSGDYELWKVYARGLTGNVTGIIFPNWDMIDESEYPEQEEQTFSIDFGYTNDPTAIIKQCRIGNTLFIKELAYETGLPTKSIRSILLANGYKAEIMPLFCEHDPDMIKSLRNLGITALPARKGQGSVNAGIELLKTFNVKYTNNSQNLHRERGLYVWMEDKEGKLTNIPVDNNNHCFDAIRYGAYTRYLKKTL